MTYFVHETAVVDEQANIGSGTRIWHYTHVSYGAYIGKNATLGQNVFIGKSVKIGDGCKIQNNVSVFEKVTLEKNVFCGPSMVFTNVVNPRAHISQKDNFTPTLVKEGVTIGANATILCGITIGEFAFIGAGSVVTRDVKPYALLVGNPAQQTGWVSEYGQKIPFKSSGVGEFVCPHTGQIYQLENGQLKINK